MLETIDEASPSSEHRGRRAEETQPGRLLSPPVLPAWRVLLITEGTYPFYFGGVSTWCHGLLESLPEIDFSLLSIIDGPERPLCFELPPNVVEFRAAPLWGVKGQADLVPAVGSADLRQRQRAVTATELETQAVPLITSFVEALMADEADAEEVADVIHGLYRFFVDHDFDTVLRSEPVWRAFAATVTQRFGRLAVAHGYSRAPLGLTDLTEGMTLVRAWLAPLSRPLPQVDIAHAAMAGMCTLVAVAAKRDQGASFMLTEHGIFLRERLLAEAPGDGSLFLKLLRLRFALRTTELSYALADRVAPCCDNHQRWELRFGAPPEKLETIYYGVDSSVFRPVSREPGSPPTVVWVGRIDPLKDVETLIRAAAIVHRSRPDILFRVYGAAQPGSEDYHDRCLALRAELGLRDVVIMEGYTSSPAEAFNQADLVALSSISEGFPYTTLEAMLCSKAIVATQVGGIAEQVGGCGRVVEPRNPQALGDAILELMNDPVTLAELGERARDHAEELFSQERERRAHLDAYSRMTDQALQAGDGYRDPLPLAGQDIIELASVARASVAPSTHRESGEEVTAPVARQATAYSDDKPAPELGEGPLAVLVAEVRARIPLPVHAYEIAAVLESCGVTDETAHRHDAADVFELAERVLRELRSEIREVVLSPHIPPVVPDVGPRAVGWLRWSLLALPSIVVIGAIQHLRHDGAFPAGRSTALMIGLLAGVFVSNALLQGLVPRAALYVGCGNWHFARRVARGFTVVSSAVFAAVTVAGLLAGQLLGWGTGSERALVATGFVLAGALWLASAGLVVTQALYEVGVGAALGTFVAVALGFFVGSSTVAVLVGYTVALVAVIVRSRHRMLAAAQGPSAGSPPPLRRMVREAAPPVFQAALVLGMLLSPHVAAWAHPALQGQRSRLTAFELAFNLPLLPLLTASPLIERTATLYWSRARHSQIATPAARPTQYVEALGVFFRHRRCLQYIYLGTAALAVAGLFEITMRLDWLRSLVPAESQGEARNVLFGSLVGCVLLGVALFDMAAASVLGALREALRSVAVGGAASLVGSVIVVAWLSPTATPLGLVVGSAVTAVLCRVTYRRALRHADHRYFASL